MRLPKRDFFLLPLLSLLSVLVMFGVCEMAIRLICPTQYSNVCVVADPVECHLYKFKLNCTVRGRIAEGPWIVLHFLPSSTRHFEPLRLATIIDVDTGAIVSGEKSIAQSGEDILDFVIRQRAARFTPKGKGQEDFLPWKRGITL